MSQEECIWGRRAFQAGGKQVGWNKLARNIVWLELSVLGVGASREGWLREVAEKVTGARPSLPKDFKVLERTLVFALSERGATEEH